MEASRKPYDSKALFNSLLSGCQDDSDSDGSSPDSPPSPNKGATTNGSPSPALNSVLNSGSIVSSASSVTNPADLAPIYRIGGQPVVSLAGAVAGGASSSGCSPATVTVLPGSQSSLGTLMYQTPQGLLYAAPPGGSLPEALLLNLSQPVSLKTEGDCSTQQYITIPVPVSMAQQQAGSASSSSSSKRERTGK